MKTNTLNVILTAVASSAVVLMATSKIPANYFDLLAMGVSYTAMAMLVALTIVDYRGNVKNDTGR